MKIHEDRSHMNIDTRWFEKGYAKSENSMNYPCCLNKLRMTGQWHKNFGD